MVNGSAYAVHWKYLPSDFYLDTASVYRCSALDDLTWLQHGFGTKRSPGWLDGRNVTMVRQIHSDIVVIANGNAGVAGEGDAVIASRPEQFVAVKTADCLSILMADRQRRIVAAVHAGWRGTVADIAGKAVRRMQAEYGCRPQDLLVAIGPGIGPCCFEVGAEVASRFQAWLPERTDLDRRTRIDMVEVNRRCLGLAGLEQRQIVSADLCTRCGVEWFESYRRDGAAAGRMVSGIGIREH